MTDVSATLGSDFLTVEIGALGAEMVSLRDADGRDLLWNGDAAFWTGRAPLLFPIVGRLTNDTLIHDGVTHPMTQHGFARRRPFELMSASDSRATFRLVDDEETRKQYPFAFGLYVTYTLNEATLTIEARVHNPGVTELPASFGFHPAFRWPLPYGGGRADHIITFEKAEVVPIHRPVGGLLSAATEPNPAVGGSIKLDKVDFERDALIFTDVRSHHVVYGAPGEPGLEIAFEGMPQLGIWSKPDAPFVCIEPWYGHASPEGFAGEFSEKPGLVQIAPGGERRFAMSVRWLPDTGR
ncbi:aldose 1-epimerase family protein [Starkeya sp. ORNL1]|uniref:aldose 1-epimerase family protein n=1 Tax=Starkeya sp. ORNL1 TaxID=2709380 RepID=UPI0014629438|nr:aldose 1-epimerase family protein [Starkeya sp. ORNL1]QJP12190.1 aldose 1-epimerase family protein [Starkeya sp. ORNL1]